MEKERQIIFCPECGEEGEKIPGNKIVLFHKFEQKPGYFVLHKWSINTGRMFSKKVSDEDEIW